MGGDSQLRLTADTSIEQLVDAQSRGAGEGRASLHAPDQPADAAELGIADGGYRGAKRVGEVTALVEVAML